MQHLAFKALRFWNGATNRTRKTNLWPSIMVIICAPRVWCSSVYLSRFREIFDTNLHRITPKITRTWVVGICWNLYCSFITGLRSPHNGWSPPTSKSKTADGLQFFNIYIAVTPINYSSSELVKCCSMCFFCIPVVYSRLSWANVFNQTYQIYQKSLTVTQI